MQNATSDGAQSAAWPTRRMSASLPAWADLFLCHLRERALTRGIVNVKLAAELADVRRMRLYRLRWSRKEFRLEWDAICAKGREIHSRRRR